MTKKDFSELAEQLAIVRRTIKTELCEDPAVLHTWDLCVDAVLRACRVTSANFDPDKFRVACKK